MYLNLEQIAESLGVSEKVVQDWIKNEDLPHVSDRGYVFFDRAQVAKWAAGRGLAAQAGFLAAEKGTFTTEFRLDAMLRAGGIWRDVPAASVRDVFARVLASLPGLSPSVRALLSQRLQSAHGISWATVGAGYALPHFDSQVSVGRDSGAVALILLRDELVTTEPRIDNVPVTRLFFFVPPSPRAHLDMLGRLARVLASGAVHELLTHGASDEEIVRAVAEVDRV
jgi:PTS system nitrogen regulatory IIA component